MEKSDVQRLTPAALAFVGDAAHTLYIRKRALERVDCVTGTLHVTVSRFVNAKSQAEVFDAFIERNVLDADELDVARRAKNAHLHSRAKTATSEQYHKATAFEAVIGYLEMTGDAERKHKLLDMAADVSGFESLVDSHTKSEISHGLERS